MSEETTTTESDVSIGDDISEEETTAGKGTTETNEQVNWRDGITDEKVRKQADRFNNPEAAVKSTLDLRQKLSKAVVIPGKDASAEDLAGYRKAVGVPETAEAYVFQGLSDSDDLDDFQKEAVKGWQDLFHENNVPSNVANAITARAQEMKIKAEDAVLANDEQYAKEVDQHLKDTWKEDYENNKTFANRAVEKLFGEDYADFKQLATKNDKLIVDHPAFIKAFAVLGREMGEGRLGPVITESEVQSLIEQANEFREKAKVAMAQGKHGEAKRYDEQELAVLERIPDQKG